MPSIITHIQDKNYKKYLASKATPLFFAMLFQALYILIETIYVAKGVGVDGLSGLSVSMPILMIIQAIIFGLNVGAVVLISRNRGSGNTKKIKEYINNLLISLFSFSILTAIILFFFNKQLLSLFTNSKPAIKQGAIFLKVNSYGVIILIMQLTISRLFMAETKNKISSTMSFINIFGNIIFGYIFILKMNLGIAGAAWSINISNVITLIYGFFILYKNRKTTIIKIYKDVSLLRLKRIKELFIYGASPFLRNITGSLLNIIIIFFLNILKLNFYIPLIGVLARLTGITIMPLIGVTQGVNPIMSFLVGAKKWKETKRVLNFTIILQIILEIIIFIVIIILHKPIINAFTDIPKLRTAIFKMYIISMLSGNLLSILQLAPTFFLQGIKKNTIALSLTLSATIIMPLIFISIFIFIFKMKITGIYLGIGIGNLITSVATLIISYKKINLLI